MAKLQAEAREGTLVEASRLTVGQYLERWLVGYRSQVRAGSWSAADGHVRNYLAPNIGDVGLQALDRAAIKELYATLRSCGAARARQLPDGSEDRSLSAKTVHNVHLTLHRALEDAVHDGLLRTNPAASVGRGRGVATTPPKATVESWTAAELASFLAAARSERLYPLLHLAAYTGMRRGELIGLRWRSIDLDAATVTVIRQRLKDATGVTEVEYGKSTRSRRTIDLDPDTIAVLHEHRARSAEHRRWLDLPPAGFDDLVFVGEEAQPLYPDTVSQLFDRIVTGLRDVRRVSLHSLRHTHATLLLAAGVPPHVVSRRLGHASEAFTLSQYSHVLPQQGAHAAAAFADAVRGRSTPPSTNDFE